MNKDNDLTPRQQAQLYATQRRKKLVAEEFGFDTSDILTRDEAARILCVSRATISNWVRHGYIKRYGVSSSTKFYYKPELINHFRPT